MERAGRLAARWQNDTAAALMRRLDALPASVPLTELADHQLFPFTYDSLVKAISGRQWMSLRLHAAMELVLGELEKDRRITDNNRIGDGPVAEV